VDTARRRHERHVGPTRPAAGRDRCYRCTRMKKLWDISPPVSARSPLFPCDAPYRQSWTARIGPGCPVNLSAITMSPHIGAHADAPLHYGPDAATIGEADPAPDRVRRPARASIGEVGLAPYLGPCRVIHAIACGPLVRPEHLAHAVDALPQRVLVR